MEKQKLDRTIWISVSAILLLLLISGIIYYRYRFNRSRRIIAELQVDSLQSEISGLIGLQQHLKELLSQRNEPVLVPLQDVIRKRLDILNGLLAKEISGKDKYAREYDNMIATIRRDKSEFIASLRQALEASHPAFIQHLQSHGLTDDEIGYACLYTLGLSGKDIGEYINLKRHYNISSEIRRKLGIDEHATNLGPYIRQLLQD